MSPSDWVNTYLSSPSPSSLLAKIMPNFGGALTERNGVSCGGLRVGAGGGYTSQIWKRVALSLAMVRVSGASVRVRMCVSLGHTPVLPAPFHTVFAVASATR